MPVVLWCLPLRPRSLEAAQNATRACRSAVQLVAGVGQAGGPASVLGGHLLPEYVGGGWTCSSVSSS